MNVKERINPGAAEAIRQSIREASGNEVLSVGSLDKNQRVARITTAARGHSGAVAALEPFMNKGDVVIHNHPSGNLTPSQADLQIAARMGNHGIGFYIVDNAVQQIYVVAEPIEIKEIIPLDAIYLKSFLETGGRLSLQYSGFEERDSQGRMLEFICEGFNSSSIRIAEAGTGVGKSLAYLIPAVDWILKNEERIVVTTATINLQQQLIEKDIPLVKKLFNKDPGAYLVKGRGNYLCINRLTEALEEYSLFEEEAANIKSIGKWAETTKTGSISDLSFYPSEDIWYRVCSEADACHGLRCRNRERCFVLKARKEAASARLLVANHHLLFSDLSMRLAGSGFDSIAVLPPFKHIIFDEAHSIEKSATSFFSNVFSRYSIAKYVSRLYRNTRSRKKTRSAGLLLGLEKMIGKNDIIKKIRGNLNSVLENAESLDSICLGLLDGEAALRISPQNINPELETTLLEPVKELQSSIIILHNLFEQLFKQLDDDMQESSLIFELRIQLKRLIGVSEICERYIRFKENPKDVYWLELQKGYRGERYVRFVITPLDVTAVMREAVYEAYHTIVFTSATLTINSSFDYWKTRVGIDQNMDREVFERTFSSPFNYKENVLLAIPSEAPLPNQDGYPAFISDFVKEILMISEGRALVLFTSYSLLNETYRFVYQELSDGKIPLMRQGEDDRNRLLKRFREDRSSVLFATDSFWEGVDAPGDSLEVVILTRLPFRVPTHPVLQARMEAVRAQGRNPFFEFSLPDAVMRLKQGFGRLMRSTQDKGVVLILDSRVVKKSYGSIFLDSLPETQRIISSDKCVIDAVENFIVAMRKKEARL